MIPNITVGSKIISAYMLCTLIGVFTAGIFTIKKADKNDELELTTVLLWSAPGVIIGGHLLFGITNLKNIISIILTDGNYISILNCFSGNVFYGGLLGGISSALIYSKAAHIDYKKYVDNAALFIPLFHFFGRIGCFLSGCCYGIECNFGFVYKYSLVESANNVRRFPIQLVEALGNIIIFLVLYCLFNNKRFEKKLLSVYLVMYSVLRFFTEFFRGDYYRGFLFSLSTSQIISIILFVVGVVDIFSERKLSSSETRR